MMSSRHKALLICNVLLLFGCGDTTVRHLVLPKDQSSNFRIFRTDGSEDSVTKMPTACGSGRGVIFFRSPDNVCYNSRNFNTKRGTVNQIAVGADRTVYTESHVTLIQKDLIDSAASPLAYYKAASRGKSGTAGQIDTLSGSISRTYTEGRMLVIEVTAQTTLSVRSGLLCSFTTGECGQVIQSGSAESYYFGDGTGRKAFSVGGTRPETDNIPDDVDKYLPTSTTTATGEVMGTDYMSWVTAGAPSEIFDEQFLRLFPEYAEAVQVCTTTECKRFAGLALANYNIHYLKTLKEAFAASLGLADVKTAELQDFYTLQGKTIEQLGELGIQNTGLLIEAQARSYEIGSAESYLDNVYQALKTDVEDAEDLAIFVTTYLVNKEIHESDNLKAAREEVHKQYPSWIVVSENVGPNAYYFTLSDSSSLITPSSEGKCGDSTCYLNGIWWLWRKENDVIEIDTPIVNSQSCGVYFQVAREADIQIMGAKPDFQRALEYAKGLPKYAYVNDRGCTHEVNLQNKVLGELNRYLEENNMNQIALYGDEYFLFNCTPNEESNVTELIGQERAYCDKMSNVNEIKILQSRINNQTITRASSAAEFERIAKKATRFDKALDGLTDAGLKNINELGKFGGAIANAAKSGYLEKVDTQFIAFYIWGGGLSLLGGILTFLSCRRAPVSTSSDPG